MPLPKPTFNNVLSQMYYPIIRISANDFGGGGRIINNPAYEHSCALRLSTALEAASPGFLGQFTVNQAVHLEASPGHYIRITHLPPDFVGDGPPRRVRAAHTLMSR